MDALPAVRAPALAPNPPPRRVPFLNNQCNTGVKNFMEHLTLLAGRLPPSLSERLQPDLRVRASVTAAVCVRYILR